MIFVCLKEEKFQPAEVYNLSRFLHKPLDGMPYFDVSYYVHFDVTWSNSLVLNGNQRKVITSLGPGIDLVLSSYSATYH